MKNSKYLLFPAMIALISLAGCKEKQAQKGYDGLGFIPESVTSYQGDIDVLLYIEGQSGEVRDIGNPKRTQDDFWDSSLARFGAAAREFRNIAPGVRINVRYTSIANYNDAIMAYISEKGHVPHIMHGTDHVNEMIQKGYATDLSKYKNSELYQSYDDGILNEFNFGGFQGAFPYMIYPMGIYVNTRLFESSQANYGDYDALLADYTFENFVEACENAKNFDANVAAMPHIAQDIVSYMAPSINQSYKFDRRVELNNSLVEDLLELEKRLYDTVAYEYISGNNNSPKPGMDDAGIADWNGNKDFIQNDRYVFNAEMPWNLGLLSLMATEAGKEADFDYLPWPKADEDSENVVGMIAEGLTIGNQCPLDATGTARCVEGGELATDVAAYFTMFLTNDPRSLEARSEIDWLNIDEPVKGVLDLPTVDRNFKFSFQAEDEENAFYIQLRDWLECYSTWWQKESEDDVPDVYNYENIKPGFKQVLEIFYGEDETRRINFYGIPDNLPNAQGGTDDIMKDWTGRYNCNNILISDSTWVSTVRARLSEWQTTINQKIDAVYNYFQECINEYYGEGVYNVLQ